MLGERRQPGFAMAYACGSKAEARAAEYARVVKSSPCITQHYGHAAAQSVYTGITRGKQLVVWWGRRKHWAIAVKTTLAAARYTVPEGLRLNQAAQERRAIHWAIFLMRSCNRS